MVRAIGIAFAVISMLLVLPAQASDSDPEYSKRIFVGLSRFSLSNNAEIEGASLSYLGLDLALKFRIFWQLYLGASYIHPLQSHALGSSEVFGGEATTRASITSLQISYKYRFLIGVLGTGVLRQKLSATPPSGTFTDLHGKAFNGSPMTEAIDTRIFYKLGAAVDLFRWVELEASVLLMSDVSPTFQMRASAAIW